MKSNIFFCLLLLFTLNSCVQSFYLKGTNNKEYNSKIVLNSRNAFLIYFSPKLDTLKMYKKQNRDSIFLTLSKNVPFKINEIIDTTFSRDSLEINTLFYSNGKIQHLGFTIISNELGNYNYERFHPDKKNIVQKEYGKDIIIEGLDFKYVYKMKEYNKIEIIYLGNQVSLHIKESNLPFLFIKKDDTLYQPKSPINLFDGEVNFIKN